MMAMTKILAGGVTAVALIGAAPAAAQYYPGSPYGYGNGYGGNPVGQVIAQVLGGGYGGYGNGYSGYGNGYGGYGNGYGANSQAVVSQCVSAVQARLGGGYNNYGGSGSYGGYSYYPYENSYPGGRVLGISRVEPRSGGGLTVRGVASSGRYGGAYGGGYGGQGQADLTFKCRTDYRGFVTDVDLDRARSAYGSNYSPYNNYDYSQYGYRRY
jgi:hypothetical protein